MAPASPVCNLCAVLRQARAQPDRPKPPQGSGHEFRIALVDDDPETRRAAREMLRKQRDGWTLDFYHPCPLACEPQRAADPPSGGSIQASYRPGGEPRIILLGVSGTAYHHLACLLAIRALASNLPVIILSAGCHQVSIGSCVLAGARGHLAKPVTAGELARAVKSVLKGCQVLCPQSASALVRLLNNAGTATLSDALTPREQQLVACLIGELTSKEICVLLDMKPDTLHAHLGHLFTKLAVQNRRSAVRKALGLFWRAGGGGIAFS